MSKRRGPSCDKVPSVTSLPRTAPDVSPGVRRLILVVVAIAAGGGVLGAALSPYLLVEHPLWLVALNPDSRHVVLAAAQIDAWQLIAVAAPRRGFAFVATYGLGSLYGYKLIVWLEKKQPWLKKLIDLAERMFVRFGGWMVLVLPVFSVAGLAGVGRLPLYKFVLATIPGQIAWAYVMVYFGDAVSNWTEPIIAFLSEHLLESTLICIGLVAIHQIYRRYRKSDDEPDL